MLHSMNTITGVSLARTTDRLDSMNEDIRSRGLYLSIVVVVLQVEMQMETMT
jgi:hypothetical protein